jgi:hypothetical protein
VVRVGDGSAALNLASTAAFIEERTLGDGSLVRSAPLPTAVSGGNQPLTLSGSAPVEGTLKRSVDGSFVTLAGYATAPGTANVAYTRTSTVKRVVARIAGDLSIDTTTLFTTAFSGTGQVSGGLANDRAVTSYDGSAFWVAGAGTSNSGGIWYIPFGTSSATQITGQSGNNPGNVRTCGIFGGQLYAATNVSPFAGVFTVGTGLPTTQSTAVILPGFPASGSPSPLDFAVLDRDPNVAGPDTLCVSDDRTSGGGGIQKWIFNGSTWTLAYTLSPGSTTGIRHLLAIDVPAGVVLLGGTTDTANSIVRVLDTGSASTFKSLVTAATNTAFRGLALSPVP